MNRTIAMLFVLGVLFSCKKKTEEPAPSSITTASGAVITNGGSYSPSTAGSSWNYSSTLSNPKSYLYTGVEKTINGFVYQEMKQTSSTSTYYFYTRQDGNKYYSIIDNLHTPVKYIDLDLPLGTNWKGYDSTNQNIITYYDTKITGVNLTHTVNNLTFNNVIAVENTTSYVYTNYYLDGLRSKNVSQSTIDGYVASLKSSASTSTNYYALNIGFIEGKYTFIASYDVK